MGLIFTIVSDNTIFLTCSTNVISLIKMSPIFNKVIRHNNIRQVLFLLMVIESFYLGFIYFIYR